MGTKLISLSTEITFLPQDCFILSKKNHSDGNYIFWPDQAGCHYAEDSLDFLCDNLIHHVNKVDNPANLPEVRPIEDFWSILKAKVYENQEMSKRSGSSYNIENIWVCEKKT